VAAMTNWGVPTIRKRRPGRDRVPPPDDLDVLLQLLDWEPFYETVKGLPGGRQEGEPGRPPDFPPDVIVLFGMMCWGDKRCQRRTERFFANQMVWSAVQAKLAPRFPKYGGLMPGAKPVNRSDFRRWRSRYGITDDVFDALLDNFQDLWLTIARTMGIFDSTKGSVSHPASQNVVFGDVTTMKSLYDAAPGTYCYDPHTGERTLRRHDPDAGNYSHGDKRIVYGTQFGLLAASTPSGDDRLIFDLYSVHDGTPGADEGTRTMDRTERLKRRAPALAGLVYDKALRGKHIQRGYEIGIQTITKVARDKNNNIRDRTLGHQTVHLKDGSTSPQLLWAFGGAAHIVAVADSKRTFVRLTRGRIFRNPRKRTGTWCWYCQYTIPDDVRVAERLRGGRVTLRMSALPGEKTGRVEALRPIAEGDPDWQRLYGLRNGAESINSWLKSGRRECRAPCKGRAAQRFSLLCGAMFANFRALLSYCERTGCSLTDFGVAAPP